MDTSPCECPGLDFGANRHVNVISYNVGSFCWSLMTICMLPIAGRLLTDSFNIHCYCSFSLFQVLHVGDFDCSVLPIVGRPATIK